MSKPKKTAATPVAPQNAEEADRYIHRIGECQRALERISLDLEQSTAQLKQGCEAEAAPYRADLEQLLAGLELYAARNRPALTHDDRVKTVKTGAGVFGWRLRPPSVRVQGKIDVVLASLRSLGLARFIRVKEELDKDGLLAEPVLAQTVPGIKIASAGEVFFCEPAALGLAPQRAA